MKPRFLAFPLNLLLTSSAVMAVLTPLTISAATFSWDGGGTTNSWGTADNWDPNGVPVFGNTADLVFNNLTRPSNFLGAIRTIRSISYGADIDGIFQASYQDFSGGASRVLTMDADSGNASITVLAGATGDITLGTAGGTGSFGTMALADNLDIVHNGSGLLLFNRAISGTGFGITKTGTGTMRTDNFNTFTGAININEGTLVANTFGSNGEDLNAASAINLGGGALEIRASSGTNKTYATVPVNVSAASTLTYNNVNAITYTGQFTGAGAFAINADLTVKNTSTNTAVVNAFNIGRAITGSGDMFFETYNNISSSTDSFSLGRILLSGDNSAWNGDLVVAKGTASLSGNAVNSAGTGSIIIGTSADAFGAGLTFFPTGTNGSTITYANNITVNAGGFRAIKGGGTDHNVTLSGGVALNGDLTVDHSWGATDRRLSLNGIISGNGGLTITKAGGNAGTTARLGGVNTYLGNTTVTTGASLVVAGSLTSDISVATGARFGGDGSTSQDLSLASGANFIFSTATTFDVSGSVALNNSFGVSSLLAGSQGEAVNWSLVNAGTYTLIGTTASTFNNISNFGLANAADLGGGKSAYFQNGSGLQLVVTASASGYDAWKLTNGTTGALDADHDGDGVDNGTEYFLGGNTSTTGFTPLPGVTGGSVTWIMASIGYAGAYNIDFFVETSETLATGSWVTAPQGTGAGEVLITGHNVKYTFPTSSPKKFARLKVTGP